MNTYLNFFKIILFFLVISACTSVNTESPKKEDNLFIKKAPEHKEEAVVNQVCYKQCFSWKKAQALDDDTAELECIFECKTVSKK